MNAWIEEAMRTMPEQYYWVHRRFKTRPRRRAAPLLRVKTRQRDFAPPRRVGEPQCGRGGYTCAACSLVRKPLGHRAENLIL
jgi:hypothetical protein